MTGLQGIIRDITARKQAEDAVKASEARYRRLIQDAADVIYTHDLQGRFLEVNEAALRTYGYTRDEFAAMNIRDLVHPDDLPTATAALQAKATGTVERTGPYELRSRTKTGETVWLEVTTRILTEAGQSFIQGIGRNVTARRQAESSLEFLKQTLPLLQGKSVDDGLRVLLERIATAAGWPYAEAWVPNSKGTLSASPAFFAARSGFERLRKLTEKIAFQRGEAVLGQLWAQPESRWIPDIQKESGVVRGAAARAAGLGSVAVVPVLDGTRFVAGLAFFGTAPRSDDPQWLQLAERAASIAAPLFARRQSEEALARHVEFTVAQFTASPVALVIVDAEGAVIAANPKMAAICGTRVREGSHAVFDLGGRVAERMADPARFAERVRDIYMSPDERLLIDGVEHDRMGHDLVAADGKKMGHVLYLRPKAAAAAPPSRPRTAKS